jgi:excisionase family DNA binding protein
MTTSEAAALLRISVRRVQQLIKAGVLRADKYGRDYWISHDDIERLIERNRKPGRPKKQK